MRYFHHKNKKLSFQQTYFACIGGNVLLAGGVLSGNKNGREIIQKLLKQKRF
jgi:uncharacterized membrane protein YsdA (DUF1294 family)